VLFAQENGGETGLMGCQRMRLPDIPSRTENPPVL
jgi:hypothetical protein